MDKLTFVVEVIKATAWPLTIAFAIVIFRSDVRTLLGRLRKGKIGVAEIEFQEGVKELGLEIAEISPAPQPVELQPIVITLAEANPRVALLDAWFEIERALVSLASKHELLTPEMRRNPWGLIRTLTKAELIPRAEAPLFHAFRRLRNQAVHQRDFNPPEDAVLAYLEIAEELKQLIRKADTAK